MADYQSSFKFTSPAPASKESILDSVYALVRMHKEGLLGGEVMPEDSNPSLEVNSKENYLYFTLPMALNYQRNSYKLWEAAKKTYLDENTKDVFLPDHVVEMTEEELRDKLQKHKVALQPNKHTQIWKTISNTICNEFDGDIRILFRSQEFSVPAILEFVQKNKKKGFPYLSGAKICVYWLYVIEQYAEAKYSGREYLTIAPDTHVIQSSLKLGVINKDISESQNVRNEVSTAWRHLLEGTGLLPIDVHTPLWLWSRGGFQDIR